MNNVSNGEHWWHGHSLFQHDDKNISRLTAQMMSFAISKFICVQLESERMLAIMAGGIRAAWFIRRMLLNMIAFLVPSLLAQTMKNVFFPSVLSEFLSAHPRFWLALASLIATICAVAVSSDRRESRQARPHVQNALLLGWPTAAMIFVL